MRSKFQSDYDAGYGSGSMHDALDPLCVDNLSKIEMGCNALEPRVRAYWSGYKKALQDRNLYPSETETK